jgi:hypothetical protein
MSRSKRPTPKGKRVYRVVAEMTISVHTDVVASSEEEARALAEDRGNASSCHSCCQGSCHEWVTGGDLDGTPSIIECEELDGADPAEFEDG